MHRPASRQLPTAARPAVWSQTFPAIPSQVGEARRSLARILDGFPLADDAILCLSELASNAVTHSKSRQPGGSFTVRASIHGDDRVRVEVTDQGGSWTRRARADGQHGRGLLIVRQLAHDFGISGDSHTGRTIWFEITCSLSQSRESTRFDATSRPCNQTDLLPPMI
jgi:serine/threonine-protein kinase RsbW